MIESKWEKKFNLKFLTSNKLSAMFQHPQICHFETWIGGGGGIGQR
jgi:hypothetical protein